MFRRSNFCEEVSLREGSLEESHDSPLYSKNIWRCWYPNSPEKSDSRTVSAQINSTMSRSSSKFDAVLGHGI